MIINFQIESNATKILFVLNVSKNVEKKVQFREASLFVSMDKINFFL